MPATVTPATSSASSALPPDLHSRITALEQGAAQPGATQPDLDVTSWMWLVLFGLLLPAALLLIGWWL